MNQLTKRLEGVYNAEGTVLGDKNYCIVIIIVDRYDSNTLSWKRVVTIDNDTVDRFINKVAEYRPAHRVSWREQALNDVFTQPWLDFIDKLGISSYNTKPAYMKAYKYTINDDGNSHLVIIAEEGLI